MDTLLTQHYTSTVNRCKAEKIVLAVQGATSLNYSFHPAMEGIDPVDSSKEGPSAFWFMTPWLLVWKVTCFSK